MSYNLTKSQEDTLRWLISYVKAGVIAEEFDLSWNLGDNGLSMAGISATELPRTLTPGSLQALAAEKLILFEQIREGTFNATILGRAYKAVDTNFDEPKDSFIKNLTPLADATHLDAEIKKRCLPTLATGSNRSNWDNACRTAGVILEERLHDVGAIKDTTRIGLGLVNDVFGDKGTLSAKFTMAAERQGYRDLYAGIVGVFRNPSAHRLVDPTPEEGGAFVVFVDLLLKKLEALR